LKTVTAPHLTLRGRHVTYCLTLSPLIGAVCLPSQRYWLVAVCRCSGRWRTLLCRQSRCPYVRPTLEVCQRTLLVFEQNLIVLVTEWNFLLLPLLPLLIWALL